MGGSGKEVEEEGEEDEEEKEEDEDKEAYRAKGLMRALLLMIAST